MLELIPHGKENAISREELVRLTGLDDRTVRQEIARLRESGEIILSTSRQKGYWQSDDPVEINEYRIELKRREMSLARTNRNILKKLYERTGQRFTTVREHERRIV